VYPRARSQTRNAVVFSPHPRAVKSTIAAAQIVRDAAEKAGAPKGLINWLEHPTLVLSQALMQSPDVKLILATGGPAMVHAAYSSGHPALGVGSGNTPAIIDETADLEMAVSSILLSKARAQRTRQRCVCVRPSCLLRAHTSDARLHSAHPATLCRRSTTA
jgi:acyl-CoA reductase-like NAD-dependent aldehyde dehydrogenase